MFNRGRIREWSLKSHEWEHITVAFTEVFYGQHISGNASYNTTQHIKKKKKSDENTTD